MRIRRLAALLSLVVAALVAATSSTPPARALEHDRATPTQSCQRTLIVPRTEGASGCWIDEHVTAQPGTLSAPCDGRDGDAQAVFGDRHFTGKVQGGVVHLLLHTQFHYSDGCNWGTTQTLDGNVRSGHLAYGYREFPLPGQHGCAGSCAASGDVRVQ